MKFIRILVVFFSLIPLGCYAANANCKEAANPIEETICENPTLTDLDNILNRTYQEVVKISPSIKSLKAGQKRWLTTIRNRCKNADCLTEAYETRIAELEEMWKKRTTSQNASVVRDGVSMGKPFEGEWSSCQLFKGNVICSTYLLVQNGKQVCGQWEYWATNRIYEGRLQAATQGQERAAVELICGSPGSETNTECEYDKKDEDRWEKSQGSLSVCGAHLYSDAAKTCSNLRRAPGMIYHPIPAKQRVELLSQPWVKRCLGF